MSLCDFMIGNNIRLVNLSHKGYSFSLSQNKEGLQNQTVPVQHVFRKDMSIVLITTSVKEFIKTFPLSLTSSIVEKTSPIFFDRRIGHPAVISSL
jgi:hypothetical protein